MGSQLHALGRARPRRGQPTRPLLGNRCTTGPAPKLPARGARWPERDRRAGRLRRERQPTSSWQAPLHRERERLALARGQGPRLAETGCPARSYVGGCGAARRARAKGAGQAPGELGGSGESLAAPSQLGRARVPRRATGRDEAGRGRGANEEGRGADGRDATRTRRDEPAQPTCVALGARSPGNGARRRGTCRRWRPERPTERAERAREGAEGASLAGRGGGAGRCGGSAR
jgi:hypothetical protein